MLNVMLHS